MQYLHGVKGEIFSATGFISGRKWKLNWKGWYRRNADKAPGDGSEKAMSVTWKEKEIIKEIKTHNGKEICSSLGTTEEGKTQQNLVGQKRY